MNKIPTAEEMFEANPILPEGVERQACISFMKTFAKLHVEAALKEASEKFDHYSNKNAILGSYSLDNIK